MVYARSWISFIKQSHDIAQAEPDKTRFSIKWTHTAGLMVLKVTDDHHCLKYKCRSSVILNRFEIFVNDFLAKQQNRQILKPEPLKKLAADKTSTASHAHAAAGTAIASNANKAATLAKESGQATATNGSVASSGKKKKKGKKK